MVLEIIELGREYSCLRSSLFIVLVLASFVNLTASSEVTFSAIFFLTFLHNRLQWSSTTIIQYTCTFVRVVNVYVLKCYYAKICKRQKSAAIRQFCCNNTYHLFRFQAFHWLFGKKLFHCQISKHFIGCYWRLATFQASKSLRQKIVMDFPSDSLQIIGWHWDAWNSKRLWIIFSGWCFSSFFTCDINLLYGGSWHLKRFRYFGNGSKHHGGGERQLFVFVRIHLA